MKYAFITILIIAAVVGLGYLLGTKTKPQQKLTQPTAERIIDDKQIIEIRAKGGYEPRTSVAKAGIPTMVRFVTSGSFDCSTAVSIPSLKITQLLPPSGFTDIEIGSPQVGKLQGNCTMGMFSFTIEFKD